MSSDPSSVARSGSGEANSRPQPLEPRTYLTVSAAGLAVSVGLLLLLVYGADRIVAAGLDHRVFYVLLVPLGMSAAAFAFGAMKSTATFQGKSPRDITLTGPAAFAAMVVVGGFFLVPEGGLRSVAVRVDRSPEDGGGPVGGAQVRLDWGPQRLVQMTDATGQASFLGLPPTASGVTVSADAEGFTSASHVVEEVPADGVIRLALRTRSTLRELRGTVLHRETRAPVAGVVLSFGSGIAVDTTDALGNFGVALEPPSGGRLSVIGTRGDTVGFNTEVPVTAGTPVTLLFGS
ncbi:MAG: hypothetical protein U5R14_08595 [Gemmatimonadota bacterium]|nr:hypothetical protein [Gemmatimonadota bacterium]